MTLPRVTLHIHPSDEPYPLANVLIVRSGMFASLSNVPCAVWIWLAAVALAAWILM
jgi:hypothetical protein